ncbi:MAG: lysophospholipid acyltransferase family protein [Candidatus Cloacimonetes bacterium]|nr:lysophospholipid acyltransferase family protein [Candidatus Cloacimonadota bacterium]
MNKILLFLAKYFGAFLVKLMGLTWRYNLRSPKPEGKVIYAFWHRNMLPLMYLHRNQDIIIMISSSKDGDFISGPAELLGYQTARGSSGRKGSKATKELIKRSKDHPIAITPDGPRGPSEKIKEGVLFLAYATELPIITVAVDVSAEKTFKSWDKFRLPYFFAKINVTYGKPFYIKTKNDLINKKTLLQNIFDELKIENSMR